MHRIPRVLRRLIPAILLGLPLYGNGCTLIFYGILKNETGDTLHLSASGSDNELLRTYPEYLCECPFTIDTLRRTIELDLPPDSAIVIGLRGYQYSLPPQSPRDMRLPAFRSVRITGPGYDRTFSDSTLALLPHISEGRRDTFMLRREP